jgi:leucyl-tRNA synthetase
MPNWAGSSWYFLAYPMYKALFPTNNSKGAWSKELLEKWMPVDWYNGGMEHTTLHLLYSRFWNKFLFDQGHVPTTEPYKKRTAQGLILASDGTKMSKSKGNVVNPDSVVETVGADTLRIYSMFVGPFNQNAAWLEDGVVGPRRFIERIWRLGSDFKEGEVVRSLVHKKIKKVSEHIELMEFNTAVSTLMILTNDFEVNPPTKKEYLILIKLLSPIAPHVTEELWEMLGEEGSIHKSEWPKYDESAIKEESVNIAVQFNGKVRGTLTFDSVPTEEDVMKGVKNNPELAKYLETGAIKKTIYVEGKLLSIVL